MGAFLVAKMQLFPVPGRKAGCGVGWGENGRRNILFAGN